MNKDFNYQELFEKLSEIEKKIGYDFTCLLLFYKAYSDKWEKEFEETKENLLKRNWQEAEAIKEASLEHYHTFNFPQEYLWENIRKEPQRISEKFSTAMKKLAEMNPIYQDIFTRFDFFKFSTKESEKNLIDSVEILSNFSFKKVSMKIVGDAYEWVLKNYAPEKPKEGKLYTSRDLIKLMVTILNPEPEKSVYDPAAGYGGTLLGVYEFVYNNYGKESAKKIMVYGQEKDPIIFALGKLNLLIHDIGNSYFEEGDSLIFPKFKEGNSFKRFDYVISNPPWNQSGYGEDILKKGEYYRERFQYGFSQKTDKSKKGDWIWIQHMLASAKEKVAVVIDTGAVSRGGREKSIRQKIVEDDLIEAIILIAEKIVSKKSPSAVIIIFNKNKPNERKGEILLINANKEFVAERNKNALTDKNIKKIVNAYQEFKNIEQFSRVITIDEARKEDYNLNPSRFIPLIDPENHRAINEIKSDLEKLEEERKKVEERINKILNHIL
jgi:type I restriction enzyme M protein